MQQAWLLFRTFLIFMILQRNFMSGLEILDSTYNPLSWQMSKGFYCISVFEFSFQILTNLLNIYLSSQRKAADILNSMVLKYNFENIH